jgi:hypothetical protein
MKNNKLSSTFVPLFSQISTDRGAGGYTSTAMCNSCCVKRFEDYSGCRNDHSFSYWRLASDQQIHQQRLIL